MSREYFENLHSKNPAKKKSKINGRNKTKKIQFKQKPGDYSGNNEPLRYLIFSISHWSCCCDNPDNNNFRNGRFILARSSRIYPSLLGCHGN